MKVEQAFLDPVVLILKHSITEKASNGLKALATPTLSRAKVFDPKNGSAAVETEHRTSKNTWISPMTNPLVDALYRRIHMFTELNMTSSEHLQMNNYGLAGHYDRHFDYAEEKEMDKFESLRNRLATFMVYLEAPEAGGATVFPNANISIFAEKGDGVFWWNLKKSGKGDKRSLHAGCPVLSGEKWVANAWIHEKFQEFLRPCSLNQNE